MTLTRWINAILHRGPGYDTSDHTKSLYRLVAIQDILVNHLAEMLLDDKPSDVRARAYSIAYELQQAGLDLGSAITDRAQQLNPWAPPVRATEPPF